MPPNPAQKVPPVAHRVPPGPHSRDVNSCPREREGGYKPIPPDTINSTLKTYRNRGLGKIVKCTLLVYCIISLIVMQGLHT